MRFRARQSGSRVCLTTDSSPPVIFSVALHGLAYFLFRTNLPVLFIKGLAGISSMSNTGGGHAEVNAKQFCSLCLGIGLQKGAGVEM